MRSRSTESLSPLWVSSVTFDSSLWRAALLSLVFVRADIGTATLVGRGDMGTVCAMRKKRWKSAPVLLATMMVSTAYEKKLRSTWSSCEKEIRQYPPEGLALNLSACISWFGSGRTSAHDQSEPQATRRFRGDASTGESKCCHTGLLHLVGFSPKRLHLRSHLGRLMLHVG